MKDTAREYGLHVVLNRMPRTRLGHHMTLPGADLKLSDRKKYPKQMDMIKILG